MMNIAPFQDCGVWQISITVEENKIVVSHTKTQKAMSSNPTEQYKFDWELCMVFSLRATEMRTAFIIASDPEFADTTSRDKRQQIRNALQFAY